MERTPRGQPSMPFRTWSCAENGAVQEDATGVDACAARSPVRAGLVRSSSTYSWTSRAKRRAVLFDFQQPLLPMACCCATRRTGGVPTTRWCKNLQEGRWRRTPVDIVTSSSNSYQGRGVFPGTEAPRYEAASARPQLQQAEHLRSRSEVLFGVVATRGARYDPRHEVLDDGARCLGQRQR